MAEKHRIRKNKLQVTLTDSELQYAKDKAKYLNLSMSEMIRKYIRKGVIIKYEPFDIQELSNEIYKIGVNINQIAKCINERGGRFDKEDIEDLQNEFNNLSDVIFNKVYGI